MSPEPHPLLSGVSFKRKASNKRKKRPQGDLPENDTQADSDESDYLEDAIGTLYVDEEGHRSKYLGRSACVEVSGQIAKQLTDIQPICSACLGYATRLYHNLVLF